MGLKEIMEKYGEPENKEGWFSFSENMVRIPEELSEYLDLQDGELVMIKPVPQELKDLERITMQINEKLKQEAVK